MSVSPFTGDRYTPAEAEDIATLVEMKIEPLPPASDGGGSAKKSKAQSMKNGATTYSSISNLRLEILPRPKRPLLMSSSAVSA